MTIYVTQLLVWVMHVLMLLGGCAQCVKDHVLNGCVEIMWLLIQQGWFEFNNLTLEPNPTPHPQPSCMFCLWLWSQTL